MTESTDQPASTQATRPASTGGLADLVAAPRAVRFAESFPTATLIKIGILTGLLILLNYRHIGWLVKYWRHPNWMHGYAIPLFSIYLLYTRRAELLSAPRKVCLWGLPVMLICLAGEIVGYFPIRNPWASQVCMIGVVFGLVWYLGGGAVIRLTWLPILFLVFAVPLPPTVYARIALPLQNFAAKGAVAVLHLFGLQIRSTASALDLVSRSGQLQQLTVAEACSGIRLLMAFVALGVAMAYLDYKPLWQRMILVAAAMPIAIFCNVLRVVITCLMYYLDQGELGQGIMHEFAGLAMLPVAFAMLWLLAWVLRHIFVEEPDERAQQAEGAG